MKIEDNFLDQEEFDKLQELMIGSNCWPPFTWVYTAGIDSKDDVDKFQFIHTFYNTHMPQSSFMNELNPILELIKAISLLRIKANLLTRTPNIIENAFHQDIDSFDDENRKTIFPEKLKQWTTSIFYMNTNNGYTEFEDGTKVESVANRMVTFPGDMKHRGTSCTNEKTRVVINFNYFE